MSVGLPRSYYAGNYLHSTDLRDGGQSHDLTSIPMCRILGVTSVQTRQLDRRHSESSEHVQINTVSQRKNKNFVDLQ